MKRNVGIAAAIVMTLVIPLSGAGFARTDSPGTVRQVKTVDASMNESIDREIALRAKLLPVWTRDYLHDSENAFYRSPFGAVAQGTPVTLRLRGPIGLRHAVLRVWGASGNEREKDYPMQRLAMATADIEAVTGVMNASQYSWWTATIPASDVSTPGTMWYQFQTVTAQGLKVYYDDNESQLGGPGHIGFSSNGPSYQLSVYETGFTTPDWLKRAVIYEVMPDRFANGDITNDENPKTQKGIYSGINGRESLGPIEFHTNWNSNPYDANIPASLDPTGQLAGNGQWNIDFFGGDLKGIQDKLDYLKSIGVNTLYLMPVFKAESNHKYDTGDFMEIDPGFGTRQDWLNLAKAAHENGFHIILDGVFEDTGSDSVYFNKFGENGKRGAWQAYKANKPSLSPYYSWYTWTGASTSPYVGWLNYDTLPQTDTSNRAYQAFIYSGNQSVAKTWLEAGADGWRLDSADNGNYNTAWWSGFRNAVKSIDPNAAIVGEIWDNATNDNGVDWLTGSTFDSVMNYSFRNDVIDFFRGNYNDGSVQHHAVDAVGFNQELMQLYSDYPKQSFYAMMNLVDSQDTMRILTVLENAPEPAALSPLQQVKYKPSASNYAQGVARLGLVSDLQFTFPGAPTIWYGDEAGLTGYNDPLSRHTYPWGMENESILNHYRLLGAIRDASPVLQTGNFTPLYEQGGLYAYARTITNGQDTFGNKAENAASLTVLNNQNRTSQVSIPTEGTIPNGTKLLDALTNQWYAVVNGSVQMTLAPYQGAILLTTAQQPIAYMQMNSGQASLAWTPVDGAAGYLVLRKDANGQWMPMGAPLSAQTDAAPVQQGDVAGTYMVISLMTPHLTSLDSKSSLGSQLPSLLANNESNTVTVPALALHAPSVTGDIQTNHANLSITSVNGASSYVVYEMDADGFYKQVAVVVTKGSGQTEVVTGVGQTINPSANFQLTIPLAVGTKRATFRVAAQNVDGQAVTSPVVIRMRG